jgi:hypothetical protein
MIKSIIEAVKMIEPTDVSIIFGIGGLKGELKRIIYFRTK